MKKQIAIYLIAIMSITIMLIPVRAEENTAITVTPAYPDYFIDYTHTLYDSYNMTSQSSYTETLNAYDLTNCDQLYMNAGWQGLGNYNYNGNRVHRSNMNIKWYDRNNVEISAMAYTCPTTLTNDSGWKYWQKTINLYTLKDSYDLSYVYPKIYMDSGLYNGGGTKNTTFNVQFAGKRFTRFNADTTMYLDHSISKSVNTQDPSNGTVTYTDTASTDTYADWTNVDTAKISVTFYRRTDGFYGYSYSTVSHYAKMYFTNEAGEQIGPNIELQNGENTVNIKSLVDTGYNLMGVKLNVYANVSGYTSQNGYPAAGSTEVSNAINIYLETPAPDIEVINLTTDGGSMFYKVMYVTPH